MCFKMANIVIIATLFQYTHTHKASFFGYQVGCLLRPIKQMVVTDDSDSPTWDKILLYVFYIFFYRYAG